VSGLPQANTLRAFCDAGLIREVMVDGTKSYFDTRVDDHPHFFWEDTRELTDAPKEQLKLAGLPDAPEGTEMPPLQSLLACPSGLPGYAPE